MATIITNEFNAPPVLVEALKIDKHKVHGDISTTTLIAPPQVRYLKRKHDIYEDIRDRFMMLLGTSIHGILEMSMPGMAEYMNLIKAAQAIDEVGDDAAKKAADWIRRFAAQNFSSVHDSGIYLERTLSIEVDGMTISGTHDVFYSKQGLLQDYKLTSVYKYMYPEDSDEWIAQQSIYAYMLRQNGYEVNRAEIVMFFRDWSKTAAYRGTTSAMYPKKPWEVKVLKLWSDEETLDYLKERVRIHRMADNDEVLPCTPKDTWSKGDSFAVMEKGKKRAKKVFNNERDAKNYLTDHAFELVGGYIQIRPGEDTKCEKFCSVRDFCPQRKERLKLFQNNEE
jgi:hypothetical protein